jgi:hypothetical protein
MQEAVASLEARLTHVEAERTQLTQELAEVRRAAELHQLCTACKDKSLLEFEELELAESRLREQELEEQLAKGRVKQQQLLENKVREQRVLKEAQARSATQRAELKADLGRLKASVHLFLFKNRI